MWHQKTPPNSDLSSGGSTTARFEVRLCASLLELGYPGVVTPESRGRFNFADKERNLLRLIRRPSSHCHQASHRIARLRIKKERLIAILRRNAGRSSDRLF